ncbi:MAG: cobalamin-dependent protein [Acidobacteriota bacterium]
MTDSLPARSVLASRRDELAESIVSVHYGRDPEMSARHGDAGRAKCLQDVRHHLDTLSEAVRDGGAPLFEAYLAWVKVLLESLGVPGTDLAGSLQVTREVLAAELPEAERRRPLELLDAGLRRLPSMPAGVPTFLAESGPLAPIASAYLDALLRGDRHTALRMVTEVVDGGVSVREVYLQVFQPAQREIGRLWQTRRITVAQEHYCTAATQLVMATLYPRLFASPRPRLGWAFVGTCVSGELHEVGLRMVADMLEMDGWDTTYLGANTPADAVVRMLAERRADVLGISATIASHVGHVEELIGAVRASEVGGRVRVMVGGHPFRTAPGLWRALGADGSADDAEGAVAAARSLVGGDAA